MAELWVKYDEPLQITNFTIEGGSGYHKEGHLYRNILSVKINGVKFIPETNATRQADRLAETLKYFLKPDKKEGK